MVHKGQTLLWVHGDFVTEYLATLSTSADKEGRGYPDCLHQQFVQ